MQNHLIRNLLETQVIYTIDEKKVRIQQSFQNRRNQLQQTEVVQKYKEDILSISLISDHQQNFIRQIKEPICIISCSHKIYDLYDLFFNDIQSQCEKCGTQFNLKNIPQDHILMEKTYKQFVYYSNERSYFCSFYGSQVFHAYLENYQNQARSLLKKQIYEQNLQQIFNDTNQDRIIEQLLIEFEKEPSSQISNVQKIHKMSLQCLIDASKINIPIIFAGCSHSLRCYEYTNILKLIEQNLNLPQFLQKETIPCFMKGCQNQISLDMNKLIQDKLIYFPVQISQQISKDYGFALGIDWCYQSNQFVYNHLKLEQFPLLKPFINYFQNDENHFFLFFGLTVIINCELSEDLNNRLNFTKYIINLNNITYPTRCYFCPLNRVFDLILFLSEILKIQAIRYFGVDKTFKLTQILKCPGCGQSFKEGSYLHELIYFDKFLAQEMEEFQLKNKQDVIINERKNLKFYLIKYQSLNLQQRSKQYQLEKINLYPSSLCQITGNRISEPIVLPLCKNKRAFEIENFVQYMQFNNFYLTDFFRNYPCQCSFCNYRKFRLNDFYFDVSFQNFLVWFQSNELWERNVVHYLSQQNPQNNISPKKPKIIVLKEEKPQDQMQQINLQQPQYIFQFIQPQQFNFINQPLLEQNYNQQQVQLNDNAYVYKDGNLISCKLLEHQQQ